MSVVYNKLDATERDPEIHLVYSVYAIILAEGMNGYLELRISTIRNRRWRLKAIQCNKARLYVHVTQQYVLTN